MVVSMGLLLGISWFGGKPSLRVLSAAFIVFVLFFASRWLLLLDNLGKGVFSRLGFSYSRSSLQFYTYRYEAPQDLFVYYGYGRSIEAESLIAKATILFHGKDPTYVRALQTHQTHNRRFGYPMLVLRHGILDGIWSKPAYLLAVLLEELRKTEGHRLKWLWCVNRSWEQ